MPAYIEGNIIMEAYMVVKTRNDNAKCDYPPLSNNKNDQYEKSYTNPV